MKLLSFKNENEKSKSFSSIRSFSIRKYIIILLIPLVLLTLVFEYLQLQINDEHFFYLQMFAFVFHSVIAFYCFNRAIYLENRLFLFLGIGFIASAIIDLLHGVVSVNSIVEESFLGYFIPKTWAAGRIIDVSIMIIAFGVLAKHLVKRDDSTKISRDTTALSSLAIIAIIGINSVIFTILSTFPNIVIDFPLSRPYDALAGGLFVFAAVLYIKNRKFLVDDSLYKGLFAYLIISAFGELVISFSVENFDTKFALGHILKDVGYFAIILSLPKSLYAQYKAKETLTDMIRLKNQELSRKTKLLTKAYEQLEYKDKLKDEFISVASHELRSPVQPILGFAELAKEGAISHQEAWDGIIKHALRLEKVSKAILDVSRIESRELKYNMRTVNINKLVGSVSEYHKVNLKKTVSIEIILDKCEVEVLADHNLFTQVLDNIINNAQKFTEQGIITIETRVIAKENKIEILVSDTGPGVLPDVLPNIFDKFVTKNPTEINVHGAGLGLYISKAIVTAHQGKISISNNKEKGATVKIELPIMPVKKKTSELSAIINKQK
jgi:signal transduction histidine kinase